MSNKRISDKIFKNMNLKEKKQLYEIRGWKWINPRKYRRIKKNRKKFRRGGIASFLRSYISYPYRLKTRCLGKGRMVTSITQIMNGVYSNITVTNLSEVAFSQEFQTLKQTFQYYKILGIGITFMPQNLESSKNLYFMICWNGQPVDNFRINDSVSIVSPFLTRPKTFFFKIPRMEQFTGLPFLFRDVNDTGFLPVLQMQAKDNTVTWHVRIDVMMEFRTLTSRNAELQIIYENEEEKIKEEEILKKEKEFLDEWRKKMREKKKKKEIENEFKERKLEKYLKFLEKEELDENERREFEESFEEVESEIKEEKSKEEINKKENIEEEINRSKDKIKKIEDVIKKEEDNKEVVKEKKFELEIEKNKLKILEREKEKVDKKIKKLIEDEKMHN